MLQGGLREPGGTSMSLWGYVGKHNDTEFGGKTGTSNNHSDAWFVGVSPNLVAGAWAGGEYRCIHFRTGALGQGSRTALPICGYFFQSVLDDPNMKHYHGKFPKPKDNIAYEDYNCSSYWHSSEEDSTLVDSTDVVTEQPVMLDENGNPIEGEMENHNQLDANDPQRQPTDGNDDNKKQEATEKKKKKPTYEDVYL